MKLSDDNPHEGFSTEWFEFELEKSKDRRAWYERVFGEPPPGFEPASVASEPDSALTPDATMLVRKSSGGKTLGDPAFYIYPFLPGDASESAIEEGTFISAYPRAIEGASFGMDYNEIAMNAAQVRKLIAALEYALSTITE